MHTHHRWGFESGISMLQSVVHGTIASYIYVLFICHNKTARALLCGCTRDSYAVEWRLRDDGRCRGDWDNFTQARPEYTCQSVDLRRDIDAIDVICMSRMARPCRGAHARSNATAS